MSLVVAVPPTQEPFTLDEAKLHLRVDITDDDYLIQGLIAAARKAAERITRHALLLQTWDLYLDEFPMTDRIVLAWPPLQSVTHIKYTTSAAVESTFAAASYQVDTYSTPARIVLKDGYSWPSDTLQVINGVVVRFVAGFGGPEDVPDDIRQAMLLMIAHWYENREAVATSGAVPKEIPFGVDALLYDYHAKAMRWP